MMQQRNYIIFIVIILFSTLMSCADLPKGATHERRQSVKLNFLIEPIVEGDEIKLKFELKFQGNAHGNDMLVLPSTWGGEAHLDKEISNLVAKSENTRIFNTANPSLKKIVYPKNGLVHIAYELNHSYRSQKSSSRPYYRPIVKKNHFHIIGETAFILPLWDMKKPIKTQFVWKNIPDSWSLANSFGAGKKTQTLNRPLEDIKFAVYTGGDFRLYKRNIKGNELIVAIRDQWQFSDQDITELVSKGLKAQRDFWKDHSTPYYLVSIIPSHKENGHYAGTSLTNSFSLFLSTDKGVNKTMKHLVMHELFHNWNGNKMKRQAPEELVFWFSEGLTEYFARKISLTSGLITLKDYVTGINQVLYEYHTSSAKYATNSQVLGHFWNNSAISRIPYLKGELLALNWDHQIPLRSFLKDIYDDSAKQSRRVSNKLIETHLEKHLKEKARHDITAHIVNGQVITQLAPSLGPCITLTQKKMGSKSIPQYELSQNHDVQIDSCLEYFK